MSKSIFQSAVQDVLQGATVTTNVAVSAGYDVTQMLLGRPDWRVKWGVETVTITWTLPSPVLGDIFVLPQSNLTSGTLTNGSGLSQTLINQGQYKNGLSRTWAVDLTIDTPNDATRTSNVWNLVIVSNGGDVVLGAALSIYSPKTQFTTHGIKYGVVYGRKAGTITNTNEYLSIDNTATGAAQRTLGLTAIATDAEAVALENMFDGSMGDGLPSLFWLNPDTDPDAYFGLMPNTFNRTRTEADINNIQWTFTELSKGVPIL